MSRRMGTSSTTQMAQIMVKYWRSSGSLWTKFVRTPICWPHVGKTVRSCSVGTWMVKRYRIVSIEQEDCSSLCMWTISKMAGKKQKWNRLGKFSWKTLIWENQHHFLTMFIWVALNESVRLARIFWRATEICSNPGFLLEPKKNYRPELQGNLMQKISSWSYDMEGHAKKCVERYCELANETTQQLHKVATPCIDDHQLKKKKKMGQVENCPQFAHK